MERAKQIWEESGLPRLAPKVPWFGYSLGLWTKEKEEEAVLTLEGKHKLIGGKLATLVWIQPGPLDQREGGRGCPDTGR